MNRSARISFVSCLLLICQITILSGQNVKAWITSGDREFARGNYSGASVYYKKALEKNNNITEISFKYAESLRLNREYTNAAGVYRDILKNNEPDYPLALFWYACMLKSQGIYDKAAINFQRFYRNYRQNKEYQYYILKSRYESTVCGQLAENPVSVDDLNVTKLDTTVNSPWSEFGAVELPDSSLFFASFRPLNPADTGVFNANIFVSKKMNNNWQKALSAGQPLNSPLYQNANLSFDQESSTAYFSRCPIHDNHEKCKIYQASLVNGQWINIHALPAEINDPAANNIQPCIAATPFGRKLIFASDRQGGKGKYDIWYSPVNPDGSFGKPVNAGDMINSIDDEVTPFYYGADTVLFFSSTWHAALGGFDIFRSKGDFSKWELPVNLGKPINSSADDLYYWFNPVSRNVYFVSNRGAGSEAADATCCNDIYTYRLPFSRNDSVRMQRRKAEEARILGDYIHQAKELVPLNLYFDNDQPDPKSTDSTTRSGYDVLYDDYMHKTEEYRSGYSDGLKGSEKTTAEDEINSFFIDQAEKGMDKLLRFLPVLLELLEKGQTVRITLKSYASPLNTVEYNELLSKRRIDCLQNYLLSYDNHAFQTYIRNGRLKLTLLAFGKSVANPTVSDDIHDLRNSVYSPSAARERRIELVDVEVSPERQ
ncbi:MAG: tetratricopeptide repeat protein [Bacteroidia bacterium]|nr:tetratricopeptide repeat protein [Bacteroidia bacterium]